MADKNTTTITVETIVSHSKEKIWELWTEPGHITQWNFAIDTWHCPSAESDLRPGGHFSWRMEARDGSMGFDFAGTYEKVEPYSRIQSRLGDGRLVTVVFSEVENGTRVTETFEAENENSNEMQRQGWQAILENFRKYADAM